MTQPNVGPAEPLSPAGISPQPFQNQPLDQQQRSSPPPAPLLDPAGEVVWTSQGIVAPPATRVATASAWIALVCGLLSWVLVGGFMAGLYREFLGMFSPIPAIIFGILGVGLARRGRTSHLWMAIAGIVLGAIASLPLIFGLLLNIFLAIATR